MLFLRIKKFLAISFLVLLSSIISSPAWAHSSIEEINPGDGSRVERFDGLVTIYFNEGVSLPKDAVKMVDASGKSVETTEDIQATATGSKLTIKMLNKVANGWYALLYQVIAEDGHATTGTTTFLVGPDLDSTKASIRDPAAMYKKLTDILRFLGYLVSILAIGSLVTSWILQSTIGGTKNGLNVFAGYIAFAGLIIAPLTLLNFTMLLNAGSFTEFKSVFIIALQSSVGTSLLIRISALFALSTAILLASESSTRRYSYIAGILGTLGIVVSFTFQGHTTVIDKSLIARTLLATHLLGASVWLGGIPGLYWFLRNKVKLSIDQLFTAVKRFSLAASISVFIVLFAGTGLGVLMFTKPSDITTKYGLSLILKFSLVCIVALIGAYNHFRLLPKIEANLNNEEGAKGTTVLKRSLLTESVGLIFILLATAFLTTSGAPAAGNDHGLVGHSHGGDLSGSFTNTKQVLQGVLGDGGIEITLTPAVMNQKITVTASATDAVDKPIKAEGVTLYFTNKITGVGPIKRVMSLGKDGSFILETRDLAISGEWEVRAVVRISVVNTLESTVTAVIAPDALNSNNRSDLGFGSVTPIIDQSQSKLENI